MARGCETAAVLCLDLELRCEALPEVGPRRVRTAWEGVEASRAKKTRAVSVNGRMVESDLGEECFRTARVPVTVSSYRKRASSTRGGGKQKRLETLCLQ